MDCSDRYQGPFNAIFGSLPVTIFEAMSRLANEHQSVNLGQGFPDREMEGPSSMIDFVKQSMLDHPNQYPALTGVPELRQAVAAHSAQYCGLEIDWMTQTLITLGATEALASAFLGLLNAGDEVVVFSPMYDSYIPMIRRAGAVPVIVQLHPPDWSIDQEELSAAFNSKTKLVVVNTPHNPTGKVFTKEELERIAEKCIRHDVYAVLDEVYEHLVFPGTTHVTMRSLPGMEQRAVRIGSAGKTFSFTDFKVGWVTGPVDMVAAITKAHQFLVFTVNSALQRAVAHGLDHESSFYLGLGSKLALKREYLAGRLSSIGFSVLPAQGTYFLLVDFAPLLPHLHLKEKGSQDENDVEFCMRMTRDAGVTLIPVSAFYEDRETAPKTLVRFVTCKSDQKLAAACDNLERYFGRRIV